MDHNDFCIFFFENLKYIFFMEFVVFWFFFAYPETKAVKSDYTYTVIWSLHRFFYVCIWDAYMIMYMNFGGLNTAGCIRTSEMVKNETPSFLKCNISRRSYFGREIYILQLPVHGIRKFNYQRVLIFRSKGASNLPYTQKLDRVWKMISCIIFTHFL